MKRKLLKQKKNFFSTGRLTWKKIHLAADQEQITKYKDTTFKENSDIRKKYEYQNFQSLCIKTSISLWY